MNGRSRNPRLGQIAAAALILAFAIAYIVTAYLTLDPASRAVPMLAGAVTVGLLCIELVKQARVAVAANVTEARESPGGVSTGSLTKEWCVVLSVVVLIAGICIAGFVVSIPLYLAGVITLIGRKSVGVAVATAVVTTTAIYVAFELVLSYRLFPGIF